jgi:hypothetical protein
MDLFQKRQMPHMHSITNVELPPRIAAVFYRRDDDGQDVHHFQDQELQDLLDKASSVRTFPKTVGIRTREDVFVRVRIVPYLTFFERNH